MHARQRQGQPTIACLQLYDKVSPTINDTVDKATPYLKKGVDEAAKVAAPLAKDIQTKGVPIVTVRFCLFMRESPLVVRFSTFHRVQMWVGLNFVVDALPAGAERLHYHKVSPSLLVFACRNCPLQGWGAELNQS